MHITQDNNFRIEKGIIEIPYSWNEAKLKKPNFIYYDYNRRFAYIQAMRLAITEYNLALRALPSTMLSDEETLLRFDILMEKAVRINHIHNSYHYRPTGNTVSWLKRAAYDLFYPATTALTYKTQSVLSLVASQVKCKQEAMEEAIHTTHHNALLEALSFHQTPVQNNTPYDAINHYNQILHRHNKTWAAPAYQAACNEAKSTLTWLGTKSLKQKCDKWILDTSPDAYEDKQQLLNIAKYLSVNVEHHTKSLVKKAKTILSDWNMWAKQKIAQIEGLSPKADDLCLIFTPTQATSAKDVCDAYPIIKDTIHIAKAQRDEAIHSKLDELEQKALHCIEGFTKQLTL